MSEIIFPNNPHNGYEFVVGKVTYIWDGTKWVSDGPSAAGSGATGPEGPPGPPGATGPRGSTGAFEANGNIVAGIVTADTLSATDVDDLHIDRNLVPTSARDIELGSPTLPYKKLYTKGGPKFIEFGTTNIGIGFTVNQQGDNILEFDGHELFAGDGDIGHHGNLNNIYASGIVSATSFSGDGSNLTKVLTGNKLKEIVAASTDFLDFQTRVAAENFDNL